MCTEEASIMPVYRMCSRSDSVRDPVSDFIFQSIFWAKNHNTVFLANFISFRNKTIVRIINCTVTKTVQILRLFIKELYHSDEFKENGIQLYFLKTGDIVYQQGTSKRFEANLSIIDVMMNNDEYNRKTPTFRCYITMYDIRLKILDDPAHCLKHIDPVSDFIFRQDKISIYIVKVTGLISEWWRVFIVKRLKGFSMCFRQ